MTSTKIDKYILWFEKQFFNNLPNYISKRKFKVHLKESIEDGLEETESGIITKDVVFFVLSETNLVDFEGLGKNGSDAWVNSLTTLVEEMDTKCLIK